MKIVEIAVSTSRTSALLFEGTVDMMDRVCVRARKLFWSCRRRFLRRPAAMAANHLCGDQMQRGTHILFSQHVPLLAFHFPVCYTYSVNLVSLYIYRLIIKNL